MTDDEERALLDRIGAQIENAANTATDELMQLLDAQVKAQSATAQSLVEFNRAAVRALSEGLSEVTGEPVSDQQALDLSAGDLTLGQVLVANAENVAVTVAGMVDDHRAFFEAWRRQATEAFEDNGGS